MLKTLGVQTVLNPKDMQAGRDVDGGEIRARDLHQGSLLEQARNNNKL